MTPYKHAQSSSNKWGGDPDDFIALHEWFDQTKQLTGDWTHRALRHHAAGIQEAIAVFGHSITLSNGRRIPTKMLAEQHVMEDCGFIPTAQDWLRPLLKDPEPWMLRVGTTKITQPLEIKEDTPENPPTETTACAEDAVPLSMVVAVAVGLINSVIPHYTGKLHCSSQYDMRMILTDDNRIVYRNDALSHYQLGVVLDAMEPILEARRASAKNPP